MHPNINILLRIPILDIPADFFFFGPNRLGYMCLFSLLLKHALSLFSVMAFDLNRTLPLFAYC